MNNKFKLEKLIELKKQKGSTRKPKYGTRKLTIGLVSCLLGFTVLFTPTGVKAAEVVENSVISSEETTDDGYSNSKDSTHLDNSNKIAEELKEKSLEDKSVKDKSNQIKENDNETIASSEKKSQADLFAPEIKEIEVVQNGTIDYKEAIMNIPEGATLSPSGEINTAELGKHTINVEIIFADGSSKSVNVNVNVIKENVSVNVIKKEKQTNKLEDNMNLEISSDRVEDSVGEPGDSFGTTEINATIEMVGIDTKPFAYDELFGTNKPELILVDRTTKKRLNYSIDKDTNSITITDIDGQPIKMTDIENGNVRLRYGSTELAAGKLVTNNAGLTKGSEKGKTTYTLQLFQVRNTDVIVKTSDKMW